MSSTESAGPAAAPAFRFAAPGGFHAELRARVAEYFKAAQRSSRGGGRMIADALIVTAWVALSYVLLVFVASTWWQVVLSGLSLGCAVAAVGFKIQHDANHGAFSDRSWVNRITSFALDAIGGSSYVWRFKHNILHHSYTNLDGADDDIDLGLLGRLSPGQRRLWFHRFQHVYLWPLYAALALKWQLFDDFFRIAIGRIGQQRFRRPRGWDLLGVCGGKVFFGLFAFLLPVLFHPAWLVVAVYAGTMLVTGFLLSVVFQLAHSVTDADHPVLPDAKVEQEWAVHQVQTTVDFAPRSPILTWCLGGLNHQVEHHLFPRVSHIHYPALSRIVEEVSAKYGVRYVAHRSFAAALVSHFRFLKQMGRPVAC